MTKFTTIEELQDFLYNLRRFGVKMGLEQIKKALALFNNPQTNLKVIHITGTNGKGSVCAMLNSILTKAGYNVGMFTSPHLVDLKERIRINGELISEEDLLRIFNKIHEKITENINTENNLDITFFEWITLAAVLYFNEKKVDYALLEVGLGGKLDATNIADSIISVVTNISLDHTDILGDKVEKIAEDKCEIIKPNSIVVIGEDKQNIIKIITDFAEKKNCKLIIVNKDECKKYRTNLLGEHQKINAGIAAEIAKQLNVSEDIIKQGLKTVDWPGRLQFIEKNILLDCAHNPAGVEALSKFINQFKKITDYNNLVIIFGCCENKKYEKMIKGVLNFPNIKEFIFTKAGVKRALDPDSFNEDLGDIKLTKIKNCGEAFDYGKQQLGENDLLLICGSIYLVGDILKYIKGVERDINEFM